MPEIERLIDRYPSQRMAALRARTRLIAREAGRASDLTRLGNMVAGLPEGEKGFLRRDSASARDGRRDCPSASPARRRQAAGSSASRWRNCSAPRLRIFSTA